jgi:hypothetical protein
MAEIREKLAAALRDIIDFHPDLAADVSWLEAADKILALPELSCKGCLGWTNPQPPIYCADCANEHYSGLG